MGGFVSISVYEETRDRFRKFMVDDESYDSALNRLLKTASPSSLNIKKTDDESRPLSALNDTHREKEIEV